MYDTAIAEYRGAFAIATSLTVSLMKQRRNDFQTKSQQLFVSAVTQARWYLTYNDEQHYTRLLPHNQALPAQTVLQVTFQHH